ncbi:LCP family protein [Hathewaya massiliensis]|uniref:LCP family protein n=1 Tax=Hathewaya massiliensis TaxID=1964382 RepID=UPI001FAA908C|nr:LCP family protein [Hathewaya massiliensis]
MARQTRRQQMIQKKRKKRKALIVVTSLIAVLLVSAVVAFGYIWNKLNSVKKQEINNVEITEEGKKIKEKHKDKNITNIALFGLDSREVDGKDDPRSDSIMVVTIDKERNKIKISSIIRDTYVDIKGRGMDKINHAYHFGGPELAVGTINKNFGLAIEDFASINFYGLRKVIDTIGGIETNITSEELKYINGYIRDIAKIEKIEPTPVTKTGKQTLNGLQAVAYCRIRYTSGGDERRAERQRYVLSQMLKKAQKISPTKYAGLITEMLPNVKTSLSSSEILSLGMDVMKLDIGNLEQQQFPLKGKCEGKKINNIYYNICDLDEAKNDIQKYIYEDIKPKSN